MNYSRIYKPDHQLSYSAIHIEFLSGRAAAATDKNRNNKKTAALLKRGLPYILAETVRFELTSPVKG